MLGWSWTVFRVILYFVEMFDNDKDKNTATAMGIKDLNKKKFKKSTLGGCIFFKKDEISFKNTFCF